jgi:hypothetical protein
MKPTLEYDSTARYGWWARARNDVQERIDGILEFIGAIAFAMGGWRKIFFALSLSFIGYGLGLSLELGNETNGHRWLAVGGFLLGWVLPLKS